MLARLMLMVLLCTLVGSSALADSPDTAKVGDIKRLVDMTGSANIAKQFAAVVSQQFFQTLKASKPEIPDRAITVMDRELMALFSEKLAAPGGLIDQVIPVYDKYFTHQEIKELIAFYETPTGKKAIVVLPKVVNEGIVIGQRWGQSLGPEIEKRVKAALMREGLLPKGP